MNKADRIFILAIAVLFCLCLPVWAETSWKATLALSEEYTDNAAEEHDGEEDFITAFRPALSLNYDSARLMFQSAYMGDYRYYAQETLDNELNHDLSVRGVVEAVEDLFFLEATERYSLVNQDRTKGDVVEGDSTTGQVQQNVFFFSPYFTPRISDRANLKTGYAYSNIWVDDDRSLKNRHRGFLDGDYGVSSNFSLLYGSSYTMDMTDSYILDRYVAYLGGRYSYAEKSGFYLKLGPQYSRNRNLDSRSRDLFWDAGYNHDFGILQFALNTGLTVEDDPDTGETLDRKFVTATVTKPWERTKLSFYTTLEEYDSTSSSSSVSTSSNEDIQRVTLGANLSHEITDRLLLTAGLRHDFDDSTDNTERWYANLGLAYSLTETWNVSSWYRFKDSSSDDIDKDYKVNSVGLQVSKSF